MKDNPLNTKGISDFGGKMREKGFLIDYPFFVSVIGLPGPAGVYRVLPETQKPPPCSGRCPEIPLNPGRALENPLLRAGIFGICKEGTLLSSKSRYGLIMLTK